MRKLLLPLAVCCFFALFPAFSVVLAQEVPTDDTTDDTGLTDEQGDALLGSPEVESDGSESSVFLAFEIQTTVGTQSAWSGKIPVYVSITPQIDSTRAQLKWDIPRGLETEEAVEVWFSMETGVVRQFELWVIPDATGSYKVGVEVIAWRYDDNYVDSAEVSVNIDDNLRLSPVSAAYSRNLLFLTIGKIIVVALVVGGMYLAARIILKKYVKWPQKPPHPALPDSQRPQQ